MRKQIRKLVRLPEARLDLKPYLNSSSLKLGLNLQDKLMFVVFVATLLLLQNVSVCPQ